MARDGRHGGGYGDGLPLMRTREGWFPRIGEGIATLTYSGAWVPVGDIFCWTLRKNHGWQRMGNSVHKAKWVELIPLPSKYSKDSAREFLKEVLSRYGAPGEVLTD